MKEKNIFVYKLFLSLINIQDFSLAILFVKIGTAIPEKSYPLFSSHPLLKMRACQGPPF